MNIMSYFQNINVEVTCELVINLYHFDEFILLTYSKYKYLLFFDIFNYYDWTGLISTVYYKINKFTQNIRITHTSTT